MWHVHVVLEFINSILVHTFLLPGHGHLRCMCVCVCVSLALFYLFLKFLWNGTFSLVLLTIVIVKSFLSFFFFFCLVVLFVCTYFCLVFFYVHIFFFSFFVCFPILFFAVPKSIFVLLFVHFFFVFCGTYVSECEFHTVFYAVLCCAVLYAYGMENKLIIVLSLGKTTFILCVDEWIETEQAIVLHTKWSLECKLMVGRSTGKDTLVS